MDYGEAVLVLAQFLGKQEPAYTLLRVRELAGLTKAEVKSRGVDERTALAARIVARTMLVTVRVGESR